jgi:hypothetical protein
MSDEQQGRLDRNSALPDEPGPAMVRRKVPAWAIITALAVLAVAVILVVAFALPNGGTPH